MKTIEEKYKKMTPIQHILNKTSMYLGSLDFLNEKQFIYSNNQIIHKPILYSPALYKIIDEIIVNSYDATIKDQTVKNIKAEVTSDYFTLFNDGIGIDVVKHKEHNIYIPELLFGNLLTSSNYDESEERVTGGTFGIGIKLSNIFSKKFIVEVWDKKTKLYYIQTFENNMSKVNKPIITKQKEIIGGIKITCYPDFDKFKTNNFSSDMIGLLSRRIIDLCGLVYKDIIIYLNNQKLNTGFDEYLKYYKSDEEWIIGSCVKNSDWSFAIRFNKDIDSGYHMSFVNGINTSKNGKHVTYLFDLLFEKLQKIVSPELTKKLLNDYLTIVIKTFIVNPSFNSQTKEELMTPPTKFGYDCNISQTFWDKIKDSDIIDKLKQIVSLSTEKILSKFESSNKKSKLKGIPKLEDANLAGTKKSNLCTLILTEGDSAKATAIAGISAIQNGRDFYGIYPLRGKLLNVREASTSQIINNQEINELKKILGLKSGVQDLDELRYGSILLMMDADEDGSHIKGLILNFLSYYYPNLLQKEGFVKILVTPIVKIFLKNETKSFPNLREYNNWLIKNPGNYKTKYYKGLGTSTSDEAKEYFKQIDKNIIYVIDQNNNSDILLAFSKDKINERKKWLMNYDPTNILSIIPPKTITINNFIHQELIHFSNYDNLRSIPSIYDGFKPSQRKVFYGCLKKNLKSEMKVAQLASYVAEITSYHHGEQSLVGTIINMAQNYVGSNNINLLVPVGQFGTKLLGGKDHASGRYIFTFLNKIVDLIFIKDDLDLLEYLEDEGEQIEPKYYLPIIPTILLNGCEGIGTGFSTLIPNHSLKDLITWFINKLTNKKLPELIPQYNNFKGQIIKYDNTTYISTGICKIEKDKIIISELPIGLWTTIYKEILEDMQIDGTLRNYTNYSSDINVHFEIKLNDSYDIHKLMETTDEKGLNSLYKILKLYKTIKLSNLTLYDTNFKLKTYENAKSICEDFFKMRLHFFQQRKDLMIEKINQDIVLFTNQVNFINLIKSSSNIFNMEPNKIIEKLEKSKFKKYDNSFNYLIDMSFKQLSKNNLDKLNNNIKELKQTKKILENKTNKDLWLEDLNKLNNCAIH